MTRDPLDELLDRSAPYAPEVVSESVTTVYQAMAQDARAQVRRPRRRSHFAISAGLTVVLAGGVTAAAAAGLFSWSGWASDPDITYSFTLPSGRQCEERILVNDNATAGDGLRTPSAGGAALKDWADSADFDSLIDVRAEVAALDPADGLSIALKKSGAIQPDPAGPDAIMIVLREAGGIEVVPKTVPGPTSDDLYANAVDTALLRLLQQEAVKIGASSDWSTNLQMQCEPSQ